MIKERLPLLSECFEAAQLPRRLSQLNEPLIGVASREGSRKIISDGAARAAVTKNQDYDVTSGRRAAASVIRPPISITFSFVVVILINYQP